MPLLSQLQQYQEKILILLEIPLCILSKKIYIIIGIFYPLGEPILPHLVRCAPFAVDGHSFMDRHLASAVTSTRE
jgi:hypothetical protein